MMEELKKLTSSKIALTDAEKKEIVKAIGLRPGHWYKCPNGHPYAIGECGGANEESRYVFCSLPLLPISFFSLAAFSLFYLAVSEF